MLAKEIDEMTVPDAWHDIWRTQADRHEETKRLTLLIDADVIRFFQAMGPGYGLRMNRVLRAFMYDRLAGRVRGPEDQVQSQQTEELASLQASLDQLAKDDD